MRAGVISASVFGMRGAVRASEMETSASPEKVVQPAICWSADRFAEEQIRGLVRVVFSPNASPLARQVVFGAIEPDADIDGICNRVGEVLAMEARGDVAIVAAESHGLFGETTGATSLESGGGS